MCRTGLIVGNYLGEVDRKIDAFVFNELQVGMVSEALQYSYKCVCKTLTHHSCAHSIIFAPFVPYADQPRTGDLVFGQLLQI